MRRLLNPLAFSARTPHTRDMNYSEITELAPSIHDRCCGEQKFLTPCCGEQICLFCEDSCPDCGSLIVWTS